MTVDEIKSQYSMRDVLQMYGIQPNRAGFIHCPFHNGDRTASCKVYKDNYHCHACGADGDIFTFVQNMEHCSFKDAFKRLGGSYEDKTDYKRRMMQYSIQKRKEKALKQLQRERDKRNALMYRIKMNKIFEKMFPVFSDDWCDAVNELFFDFIELEYMTERRREQ